MDVDAVAAELYALPPGDFTARRSALVSQARREGDPAAGKQIGALRRPTVSAWSHNVLVARADGVLRELLDVGEALRDAQAGLDTARMNALSAERRRLVQGVQQRAAGEAARAEQSLSAAALREVEETLAAAVASAQAADAVASGRLTRALSYAGFGEVDLRDATATPAGSRSGVPRSSAPQRSARSPASERSRLRLVEPADRSGAESDRAPGRARAEQARAAVRQAEERLGRERRRAEELSGAVRRLQEELAAARADAAAAARDVATAERRHDSARLGLKAAERAVRSGHRGPRG